MPVFGFSLFVGANNYLPILRCFPVSLFPCFVGAENLPPIFLFLVVTRSGGKAGTGTEFSWPFDIDGSLRTHGRNLSNFDATENPYQSRFFPAMANPPADSSRGLGPFLRNESEFVVLECLE